MNLITIQFLSTASGSSLPDVMDVVQGTTLLELLRKNINNFESSPDAYEVSVNRIPVDDISEGLSYVLKDKDRVSVGPRSFKGG